MKPFDPNKYGNPRGHSLKENVPIASIVTLSSTKAESKSHEDCPPHTNKSQHETSLKTQNALQEQDRNPSSKKSTVPIPNKPIHIPGFDPTRYGLCSRVAALSRGGQRKTEDLLPKSGLMLDHSTSDPLTDVRKSRSGDTDRPSAKGPRTKQAEVQNAISSPGLPSPGGLDSTATVYASETSTIKFRSDLRPDITKASILPHISPSKIATGNHQPGTYFISGNNISDTCEQTGEMSLHSWEKVAPKLDARGQNFVEGRSTESAQDALKRIQAEGLKKIVLQQRNRPEPQTTSLRDLGLARLPPSQEIAAQIASRVLAIQKAHTINLSSHVVSTQPTPTLSPKSAGIDEGKTKSADPPVVSDTTEIMTKQLSLEPRERPFSVPHVKARYSTPRQQVASSIDPGEASPSTDDSVLAMAEGTMNQRPSPPVLGHKQGAWNKTTFVPPVDWDGRPMFDINTPEFKNTFNNWANATTTLRTQEHTDDGFATVPYKIVKDTRYHADGISMVHSTTTVNSRTAPYYGYECEPGIIEKANLITDEDYKQNTLRDPNDASNPALLNYETTELLVQTWLAHHGYYNEPIPACANDNTQLEATKDAAATNQDEKCELKSLADDDEDATPKNNEPKINIYVRPAVRNDIPQMTNIYNWYVENTTKPAETSAVTNYDMEERFDYADTYKLPFLVAVRRSNKRAKQRKPRRTDGTACEEMIVGWACASDFSAKEYAERITADLEIYVDHVFRQLGVANCLMDRLLESVDHGHSPRGGYPFHCAQEVLHQYTGGGQRDLHKLVFLVRTYQYPKKIEESSDALKGKLKRPGYFPNKLREIANQEHDREDELDGWLRTWLESWGFEVEGTLKGVGVKNGRYLNMTYFARTTWWAPEEGKIP